ncbi:TetR/AcrR family transcriptional regulator C-terminal ligand-binding domain-containing protein [Amycolatopsis sp. cg5]|uniref:TetR/AcrR family transcriptional regulator n=1 Tax=Amycolatopsis sp. cg5 TaxID=3238802 RepID=UPI003526AEA9
MNNAKLSQRTQADERGIHCVRHSSIPPRRAGARPQGRPRSELANRAIIGTTLDMLAEGQTVTALSVEGIAARAKVGKATIYRRWAHKHSLILDAIGELDEPPVVMSQRSTREDLELITRELWKWALHSKSARVLPQLVGAQRSAPELLRRYDEVVIEPWRTLLRQALLRGTGTGEVRHDTDLDLAVKVLIGPPLTQLVLGFPDGRAHAPVVGLAYSGVAGELPR